MEADDHRMRVLASLNYEAPFLLEKLLTLHIADNAEEAKCLFDEVKKYLVLCELDETTNWKMYSTRIDEVWHQFVLFTREYTDYSQTFFRKYIHHNPSNAPKAHSEANRKGVPSFQRFHDRYQSFFGTTALPDVWYDERSVTLQRRIINHEVGRWTLKVHSDVVEVLDTDGEIRLSVNDLAGDAISFIADTGAFYVRELPENLSAEEKVALIAMLVEHKLLRVAP